MANIKVGWRTIETDKKDFDLKIVEDV